MLTEAPPLVVALEITDANFQCLPHHILNPFLDGQLSLLGWWMLVREGAENAFALVIGQELAVDLAAGMNAAERTTE